MVDNIDAIKLLKTSPGLARSFDTIFITIGSEINAPASFRFPLPQNCFGPAYAQRLPYFNQIIPISFE